MILLLLACSQPAVDSGCSDALDVNWDSFGHRFFTTYCTSCHSINNTDSRYGAPPTVNFDNEAEVRAMSERVRIRVIEQQDMPISGGVYEDDLYLLDIYLRCP